MPYCFSRSYVKFQGHTAQKIVEFDPNWAFPDCNSSFNSPMAMKCCTKLETAKERCPIVFQGHPSNLMVTRDKTSPILTQIRRFRTVGRSQLSNPSDLPCLLLFDSDHHSNLIMDTFKFISLGCQVLDNNADQDSLAHVETVCRLQRVLASLHFMSMVYCSLYHNILCRI